MQKFIVDYRNVKLLKTGFNWTFLLCALPLFFFAACSSTGTKTGPTDPVSKTKKEVKNYDPRPGRVWVYRQDGSKSCGVKKGLPLTTAVSELDQRGVRVFKQRKNHDGKMRMMVCGAETGMQNELHIDGQSLPVAGAMGYRVLGED